MPYDGLTPLERMRIGIESQRRRKASKPATAPTRQFSSAMQQPPAPKLFTQPASKQTQTAAQPPNGLQSLLDVLRANNAAAGGPAPASPETVSGVQQIVAASPARQQRDAQFRGAPPGVNIDGQNYMPLSRPSISNGGLSRLMPSRVGAGIQSTGMNTGGSFGSPLMMGGMPAQVAGAAMGGTPMASRPMIGGRQATPSEFQQAWQARQSELRTAPEGDPDKIAARSSELASRAANVKARGMARGLDREERMAFTKDRQRMGYDAALMNAFARRGEDPMRAMAQVAAMRGNKEAVQYLSEDNRQQRAAAEFASRTELEKERNAIDRDRLTAEINQGTTQADLPWIQMGQAAYDQAIASGKTHSQAVVAGKAASQGKWTGATAVNPTPSVSSSPMPSSMLDDLRRSGHGDLADRIKRHQRAAEDAERRARHPWRAAWDAWGGVD